MNKQPNGNKVEIISQVMEEEERDRKRACGRDTDERGRQIKPNEKRDGWREEGQRREREDEKALPLQRQITTLKRKMCFHFRHYL